MKDDVEIASRPPKKRRALERALDKHLAIWASDENLPEAERERVQAERDRRKTLRPDKVVGVVVGPGGATREQLGGLTDALRSSHPTEVHHPFCPPRVHTACRVPGAEVVVYRQNGHASDDAAYEVARASQELIGLVSETTMPTAKVGIWGVLRFAKDRGVNVKVIWPNGQAQEGRW